VCIRCAQYLTARTRCPYCGHLHVTLSDEEKHPEYPEANWVAEIWAGDSPVGARQRIALLGGFASAAVATARSHEFIRRYVEQGIAAGVLPLGPPAGSSG
jgi:hypothetical protein